MSNNKPSSTKFNVSLLENGVHSLWRGIESYEEHEKTYEKLLLKDALMSLHHGVEVLMKEILVRRSLFLIFEDPTDAAKRQKQADESGVGIFFLDRPPKTVTFEEAIVRVDAFVKPPELDETLRTKLTELNRLRNQLEHYAIDVDREKVTKLLAELRDPLLALFEAQIGGINRLQTEKVIRAWDRVQESARSHSRLEEAVLNLLKQFNGQKVPGRLFNVEGDLILPLFDQVLAEALLPSQGDVRGRVDILGKGKDFQWVVEVKGVHRLDSNVIYQLSHWSDEAKATTWLVAFSEVSHLVRAEAQKLGILVTGASEWEELKSIIGRSGSQ